MALLLADPTVRRPRPPRIYRPVDAAYGLWAAHSPNERVSPALTGVPDPGLPAVLCALRGSGRDLAFGAAPAWGYTQSREAAAVKAIRFEYPDELLTAMDEAELQALAREALMIRLYDLGKVSSGTAAEILGISRRAFLDLLGRYGVSSFDDQLDLAAEARRA
jgi:predicted HTH domain antitoxin